MRIDALVHLQERAPRGACPGRRGKVFSVSSLYVRVLQSARFGYKQTEMKHNKFKTNKLTTAASQDQSQKPQQEYVYSNLPVRNALHSSTARRHQRSTTRESCADQSRLASRSGGVDHVAREVLQHGVANRGSGKYVFSNLQGQTEMKHTKFKTNKLTTAACTKHSRKRQDFKKGFPVGWF